jgi:hypothetical protein
MLMMSFTATPSAMAQSPSKQFGVGINIGGNPNIGGTIQYALSPAIHVGSQFGLQINSENSNGGENILALAPYGKFIFAGKKNFKPYVTGQLSLVNGGTRENTSLLAWAGAEYFVNKNLGIYGQLALIDVGFDPSYTAVGLGRSMVGIEWFF